jgi:hypothetical protein
VADDLVEPSWLQVPKLRQCDGQRPAFGAERAGLFAGLETVFRQPGPLRHHPLAQPACRLRHGGPALLPRRAPGPARVSAMLRGLLSRVPDIRAAGEPGQLLSSFVNGIKHLRCEFG